MTGNTLNIALTAINGIYLARVLGPENRGIIVLLTTLTAIIPTILNFGIPHSASYFSRHHPENIILMKKYIFKIQIFVAFTSFFILFGFKEILSGIFLEGYVLHFWILFLLTIIIFFSSLNSTIGSIIISRGDTKLFSLGSNTGTFIAFIMTFIFFSCINSNPMYPIEIVLCISLIGTVITTLIYEFKFNTHQTTENLKILSFQSFIRYGLKAQIGAVSSLVFKRIDLFIVGYFLNPQSVGYYSIALSLRDLGLIIPRATAGLLVGEIADKQNIQLYKKTLFFKYLKITSLLSVILIFMMVISLPILIPLLYGKAYNEAVYISVIAAYSIFPLGNAIVLGSMFYGSGKPLTISYSNIFASILALPVITAMVFFYGIKGAAIATILTSTILLCVSYISLKKHKDIL